MSNRDKVEQEFALDNLEKLNPYFQVRRPEMVKFIPDCASVVLDVGCADGTFGYFLKAEREIEVWGVEPNKLAASIADQRLNKVICGDFGKNLPLPIRKFDCVVFNDVLEHLIDANEALLYCKLLLSEKGIIVASIPNVRYFDNIWNLLVHKNWEYKDWGILDRTHLRFFTRRSILSTFEQAGFDVELIVGITPLQELHPHHVRKFKFINWLLLNNIEDMNYLQFALVARPKKIDRSLLN